MLGHKALVCAFADYVGQSLEKTAGTVTAPLPIWSVRMSWWRMEQTNIENAKRVDPQGDRTIG